MNVAKRISSIVLVFVSVGLVLGCASVPKETVELSYAVGQDLRQLHQSYRALIQIHFDGLRSQTAQFLDDRWTPLYVSRFIKKGELVKRAKGSDPGQVLQDVQLWAEVALGEIQGKRKELIDPIDKDERDLLVDVDDAFARVALANATITAHLNSLRSVEEVQDQTLQALHLGDLREKISNGLAVASQKSKAALESLEKAEGMTGTPGSGKDTLRTK
jgi:hypothetical protein